MWVFRLLWTLVYFNFSSYFFCFNFCICFISFVPSGITSSVVKTKICTITVIIKNYKSVTNKKKNKHDKIVLLEKDKLNIIEVLFSKTLINSYVSINNVLREYNEINEEIKTSV